jgi:protein-S-isoprenylcysteine O-methyltransferase Ste14
MMYHNKLKEKIRSMLEALFTTLLFGMQTILNVGVAIGIMAVPLFTYIYFFFVNDQELQHLKTQFYTFLFSNYLIIGRIIAVIGAAIFFVAAGQWLWFHHKRMNLFKKGLYSRVRHPQFTGIIIITLGLTVMVGTNCEYSLEGPILNQLHLGLPLIVGLWFLEVSGYIVIAWFEERSLSRRFGNEYKEYKSNVPFIFPLKSPWKIPEVLFTIFIIVVICVMLLVLPYNLISNYSSKLIPNPPYW